MAKRTFDIVFAEAVDDAFSSLGESAKKSIYFHLEGRFGIRKNKIPNRLADFESGLDKIFGIGAKYIEILIMKNLHNKLDEPLEWNEKKELAFVDYVGAARRSYLKTISKKSVRADKS